MTRFRELKLADNQTIELLQELIEALNARSKAASAVEPSPP